jgi:hypothetical protein
VVQLDRVVQEKMAALRVELSVTVAAVAAVAAVAYQQLLLLSLLVPAVLVGMDISGLALVLPEAELVVMEALVQDRVPVVVVGMSLVPEATVPVVKNGTQRMAPAAAVVVVETPAPAQVVREVNMALVAAGANKTLPQSVEAATV